MVYLTFVLSFFVFGPVYGRETLKGLQCIDHPVYKRSKFQGEIIRSWRYTQMKKHIHYFSDSGYIPRYKQHTWAPTSDQSSRKYEKLDFFATYMQKKGPKIYLHLYFQRPAKVYIFVGGRFDKTLPRVSLPGWKSEGWASMSKGDASERAHVGLMNTKDFPVSQHAYVFSKLSTDNSIAMPSMMWVSANVRGYKSNGYYFALIGEADGSPVKAPPPPTKNMTIVAGKHCPDELHDEWMVKGAFDPNDPDTVNRPFRTYHPMWDPCYWCAYKHEHGSAAEKLMGYIPRYGYAALKNKHEDESHGGFKDFVLDLGEHRLYYSIHAHLSLPRRFFTRFHTVVIVLADTKTQEVLAHFNYKADFGFASTKAAKGGMIPLTAKEAKLQAKQKRKEAPPGFREVNILDPKNLDPRVLYRKRGKSLTIGEYERWMASPMCAAKNIAGPVADIKGAQNALRTMASKGDDITILGKWMHGSFRKHTGVKRDLRFRAWTMGWDYCGLNGTAPKDGVFYTDPYGYTRRDGPGVNNMRQYIKPGLKVKLPDGIYMTDDTWLGLFKVGYIGAMRDIMSAIDPSKN